MTAESKKQMFTRLREVRDDIACLTNWLGLELDKFDDTEIESSPENFDWGNVGTLGAVRCEMLEILSFISGFDTEEIEDNLKDPNNDKTANDTQEIGAMSDILDKYVQNCDHVIAECLCKSD